MAAELNEQEKYLLQQVYSGKSAVFKTPAIIDTLFLRNHMLELAAHGTSDDPQRCSVRWVLENAIFTEQLDLSDGRRCGGGSLPAIEFHLCEFREGFCADGAHIDRLFFNNCRFTCSEQLRNLISLRNCRISTELRLEHLKPADQPDGPPEVHKLLWVDAFASWIGTNVVVKHCLLRAPEEESSTSQQEPRYALDLSTAEIKCDLRLQSSVELEGGLKVRDARIGGTFWGQGLHVSDGESDATRNEMDSRGEYPRYGIRAESAQINGNLVLSVDQSRLLEAGKPGSMKEEEDNPSPDPMRFWCKGGLDLTRIQVNGDLDLGGAYIERTPFSRISLYGAKIRGGMTAEMLIPRAVVQRSMRRKELVLDLSKSDLLLNNCRISGDCRLDLVADQIWAEGFSVDGNLQVSGTCRRLNAGGLTVGRDASISLKNTVECALGGSKLGGKLNLSDMVFAGGMLSLRDAEIGHSLVIAPLYSHIAGIRRRRLTCYPGFTLTEIMLPADPEADTGDKIASILSGGEQKVVLLTGESEPFRKLNAEIKLNLQTVEAAQEYLRLFCAYTWAIEGSFPLIEHDAQLPAHFRGKVKLHPVRPVENKEQQAGQQYFFEAFVRYGYFLYHASFSVSARGEVRMLDSDYRVVVNGETVVYEPGETPLYRPPFRLARISQRPDFESSAPAATGPDAEREFIKEVPDWSERLVRDRLAHVEVDLRAAKCGTLNDNAARVWEFTKPVKLEEFDYAGTFLPDDVSVQSELEFRLPWLRGLGRQSRVERCRASLGRFFRIVGVYALIRSVRGSRNRGRSQEEPQFRAQPYTHLAKVLRERGDDEAARDVEAEKIRWGAYDRAQRSWGGRLLLMLWWWPYGLFYRYGLAPGRAFLTLLVFWFVGFLAITMLSENDLLKANISTVAAAALPGPEGPTAVIPTPSTNTYTKKFPCGESVAPALYAAELLVPVLNLHQESRCDVRPELPEDKDTKVLTLWHHPIPHFHWMVFPLPWEYLKAVYILVGSIVTSLAILTFSGIARRWEH